MFCVYIYIYVYIFCLLFLSSSGHNDFLRDEKKGDRNKESMIQLTSSGLVFSPDCWRIFVTVSFEYWILFLYYCCICKRFFICCINSKSIYNFMNFVIYVNLYIPNICNQLNYIFIW